MARDHTGIITEFEALRQTMTKIKTRAADASTDIGGLPDNKPAASAIAKLDTEISRLRTLYVAQHTIFLAAIDA